MSGSTKFHFSILIIIIEANFSFDLHSNRRTWANQMFGSLHKFCTPATMPRACPQHESIHADWRLSSLADLAVNAGLICGLKPTDESSARGAVNDTRPIALDDILRRARCGLWLQSYVAYRNSAGKL
jgi:hypothetical protein